MKYVNKNMMVSKDKWKQLEQIYNKEEVNDEIDKLE